MPEDRRGRLSVYDDEGRLAPPRTRAEAVRAGLAVGAVNLLLVNRHREVLLQKRPPGKDNAGRWDKSVGGHVDAGEEHDAAAVREAGEELFDDGRSSRVRLCPDEDSFRAALGTEDLSRHAVFRRVALHHGLRDVRHGPEGGLHSVVFRVAVYLGRCDVPLEGFRPQPAEIAGLRYFPAREVDRMLAEGELAPNMAFLWLAHARELLRLAGP
jgi:isopentenyldiphosphate isomerase